MPLHRYRCRTCSRTREQLEHRDLVVPECCGVAMARAMPTSVVGRVVADSNGAHAGSGFAQPAQPPARERVQALDIATRRRVELEPLQTICSDMPRTRAELPTARGDIDACRLPPQPAGGAFAKEFGDCNAEERDARWRDTCEAVESMQVNALESSGVDGSDARQTAHASAVEVISRARAEQSVGGGPV
jgi:hypothetical protein